MMRPMDSGDNSPLMIGYQYPVQKVLIKHKDQINEEPPKHAKKRINV
jgi:hypothetical protein